MKAEAYSTRLFHSLAIAVAVAFLLPATGNAQELSPRHHIVIKDEGGFTSKPDKWIAKRKAKSERRNGPMVADIFEQNMLELRDFSARLDTAADEAMAEFGACRDVSRIDLSKVKVTIEAGPFSVVGYPPTFFAAGVAYQSGSIHIVYWNLSQTYGPQMATALVKGELRNLIQWWLTGQPKEMWSVPACPH